MGLIDDYEIVIVWCVDVVHERLGCCRTAPARADGAAFLEVAPQGGAVGNEEDTMSLVGQLTGHLNGDFRLATARRQDKHRVVAVAYVRHELVGCMALVVK